MRDKHNTRILKNYFELLIEQAFLVATLWGASAVKDSKNKIHLNLGGENFQSNSIQHINLRTVVLSVFCSSETRHASNVNGLGFANSYLSEISKFTKLLNYRALV